MVLGDIGGKVMPRIKNFYEIFCLPGHRCLWGVSLVVMTGLSLLFSGGVFAQGPTSKVMAGDIPVQMEYDTRETLDMGGPDETHRFSGDPVVVTALMEGREVVLKAPEIRYARKDGKIRAANGVSITDGTTTVTAEEGIYDVAAGMVIFEGQARWQQSTGDKTNWGVDQQMKIILSEGKIKSIIASNPSKPGRMSLNFQESAGMPLEAGHLDALEPEPGVELPKAEPRKSGLER